MAFHMTRKWDKERILRNYLNTIYFGNGAYGIEAAARTYFGDELGLGGAAPAVRLRRRPSAAAPSCSSPAQAALLAGVVANPTAYDPVAHPAAAKAPPRPRPAAHARAGLHHAAGARGGGRRAASRRRDDVHPPQQTSKYPYFTTWVRQQVVDQVGAGRAFEGGLQGARRRSTPSSRTPRRQAITQWLGPTPGSDGVPAGAHGRARQPDQRGARDGRRQRRRLQRAPVQPRHPGPAPARLLVQAVHPRRGAQGGHQPVLDLHVAQEGVLRHREQEGHAAPRPSSSTTTTTPTAASRPSPTPPPSPTTPSSPSSASRSGPRRSPSSRTSSASARRSRPTTR